jgi:hypothetical protein
MRRCLVLVLVAACAAGGGGGASGPTWSQWGQDARHGSALATSGQPLAASHLDVVYDPFVSTQLWQTSGATAHYMTPLTSGSSVFIETKGGSYSLDTYATETWGVTRYDWGSGSPTRAWRYVSDWKAIGGSQALWEPVFHGALANGFLYLPGAKGSLLKIDPGTGTLVSRVVPDASWDDRTYVVSPVTADPAGKVYFTVLRLHDDGSTFYGNDVVDSFLVAVDPRDATRTVSLLAIVAGAPGATDPCETTFADADLPWPPSPTATPPSSACGTQRAAVNAAPAVGPDGKVYVVTRAHFNSRYAYLVALRSDLGLAWATSLRDRFHDGCGVPHTIGGQLEPNGMPGGCAARATMGVDPTTNRAGAGAVLDNATSSPVVAPDGSLFLGTSSFYNYAQGHLMHFAPAGQYLGAYPFGWDTTPAVYVHHGTYSLVTKDNHYGATGSYCSNPTFCPTDRTATAPDYPEGYSIVQLSPSLDVEWRYEATNTERCEPGGDGGLSCVADHPHSFEWCVNAPAVDALGTVYAGSEDGWVYAIHQGGSLRDKLFVVATVSSAYTPVSLDAEGRVYALSSGHAFAMGR